MIRVLLAIVSFAAVAGFSPAACAAPILYGAQYPASSPLYVIDQNNGTFDNTFVPPTNSTITDLTNLGPILLEVSASADQLYSINPNNGQQIGSAVNITDPNCGNTGTCGLGIVSIASSGSSLFGTESVGFGASADALFSINSTTGVSSQIGLIGFNSMYALGFSGATLYGIDNAGDLVTINTSTGAGTKIATVKDGGGNTLTGVTDLAFRPTDGVMFVSRFVLGNGTPNVGSLYTVNPNTGVATLIGSWGTTDISGIAFVTPEPATFVLIGLALPALFFARRRKAAGARR